MCRRKCPIGPGYIHSVLKNIHGQAGAEVVYTNKLIGVLHMEGPITKYLNVFKMAGIDLNEGSIICSSLRKETLERLTVPGFDRRLIKPVIKEASRNQAFGAVTDERINELLDDQNFISSLIKRYLNRPF